MTINSRPAGSIGRPAGICHGRGPHTNHSLAACLGAPAFWIGREDASGKPRSPSQSTLCAGCSAKMPFELSESQSAVVAQMKQSLSKMETEEGEGGAESPIGR